VGDIAVENWEYSNRKKVMQEYIVGDAAVKK